MFALDHPDLGLLQLVARNGYVVTNFDPGFPTVRSVVSDNPDAHGVQDRTQFFGDRVVSLTIEVFGRHGKSRTEAMQAITRYTVPGLRPQLIWIPDKYAEGFDVGIDELPADDEVYFFNLRVDGGAMPARNVSGYTMHLTFRSPPFYYTRLQTATAEWVDEGPAGSTLEFPLEFPIVWQAGTPATLRIVNDGHVPLKPKFTVHGPINNFTLVKRDTGETFSTTEDLAEGETAIIDMSRYEITVSNKLVVDIGLGADLTWFECPVGTTEIQLQGSNIGGTTRLVAEWASPFI